MRYLGANDVLFVQAPVEVFYLGVINTHILNLIDIPGIWTQPACEDGQNGNSCLIAHTHPK